MTIYTHSSEQVCVYVGGQDDSRGLCGLGSACSGLMLEGMHYLEEVHVPMYTLVQVHVHVYLLVGLIIHEYLTLWCGQPYMWYVCVCGEWRERAREEGRKDRSIGCKGREGGSLCVVLCV